MNILPRVNILHNNAGSVIHRRVTNAAIKQPKQHQRTKWISNIGLEIHAQIATKSKLFSGAAVDFGAPVNSCVSLFDASIPGTLPVLNESCVQAAIRTALALNCRINEYSLFDRKHYFYADMPCGYQITQQRRAIANDGVLKFPVHITGSKKYYHKEVKLLQLQLEQDSGKSLHDDAERKSLVDLNRAGVGLIELVFAPDLENGEEAAALVKELILIMTRLNTCSCKMEEGSLRVDANVSIRKPNDPLGTRTEIKNIGSVRGVAQAISYEIARQSEVISSGGEITKETRSWDPSRKVTVAMRDKEVQVDYRFMPETNLLPLLLNKSEATNINLIKQTLPEMPSETREQLINDSVITEHAIILVNEPHLLNLYLGTRKLNSNLQIKSITNLLINELLQLCNKNKYLLDDVKISCQNFCNLLELLEVGKINLYYAKSVLEIMCTNQAITPEEIISENNWYQINDVDVLRTICENVIAENPKLVTQFKNGKEKVLFALIGEVAKITKNKANMSEVVNILKKIIK